MTWTRTNTATFTPTITVTYTVSPTFTPAPAIISLLLKPDEYTVNPGGEIKFTLTISNTGADAINLVLWDTLPDNASFPDADLNAAWVLNGRVFSYAAGTLDAGQSISVNFILKADDSLAEGTKIYVGPIEAKYDDIAAAGNTAQSNQVYIVAGDIQVYPNPYNPSTSVGSNLKFANVPKNAAIILYSLSGEFVTRLTADSPYIYWNTSNSYGCKVSPGIYLYVVKSDQGRILKTGKIYFMKGSAGN
jgi:uncharacterized repeat protein (TIGR01451 family)